MHAFALFFIDRLADAHLEARHGVELDRDNFTLAMVYTLAVLGRHGAIAASAGHLAEARALVQRGVEARDVFSNFWKLPAWAPLRADPEGFRILRSTGLQPGRRRPGARRGDDRLWRLPSEACMLPAPPPHATHS